jgi:hypothetical protein
MVVERPLKMSEIVLCASHIELGGTTQSVMVAEFDSVIPVPAIADGLRDVFRHQPMLRARLAGQAPRWRFAFDVRFDDVGVTTVDMTSTSLEEVFAAECDNVLDLEQGALWRVLLGIGGPPAARGVTLMVVTFAHAIVDGVSGFSFARQILKAVDGQAGEGESFSVRPPLESGPPRAAYEDAAPAPSAGGQWPFAKTVPFGRRRTNIVLGRIDKQILDFVLRRCRSEGVKVDAFFTAAIQAALARTNSAALSLPILSAFDVRRLMRPPVSPDEIGMFMKDIRLFDATWPISVVDVWERARSVSRIIVRERERELARPPEDSADEIYQQIRLAAMYPMDNFPFSFSVSNMGRQSFTRNGTAGLKSIYLSSTDRIGIMGFQAVLAEVEGDLHVAFVHTAPLISSETISQVRDDLTEIMRVEARKSAHL